jgi:hypothetical protein
MPDRMPLAALTYNRQTGCYGFRVWFDGRPPHYVMEVFGSREPAQDWLDPHREYVWEEEPSPDGLVLVSRGASGKSPSRNKCSSGPSGGSDAPGTRIDNCAHRMVTLAGWPGKRRRHSVRAFRSRSPRTCRGTTASLRAARIRSTRTHTGQYTQPRDASADETGILPEPEHSLLITRIDFA